MKNTYYKVKNKNFHETLKNISNSAYRVGEPLAPNLLFWGPLFLISVNYRICQL